MTPEEYERLAAKAGLEATAKAASFFEVDETTERRWRRGDVRIPGAVRKLLLAMHIRQLSPEDLT